MFKKEQRCPSVSAPFRVLPGHLDSIVLRGSIPVWGYLPDILFKGDKI